MGSLIINKWNGKGNTVKEREGNNSHIRKMIFAAAVLLLLVIQFIINRLVPFMMDDLWYSTNLATGEPLKNFGDIIQSQVWHYQNWGGRSMTHGILQLTLMSGEVCADLINVTAMTLLAWMICVLAGTKDLRSFLTANALLFLLNANIKMSVLWQSGGANYVYSSLWILVFLWPYIRLLKGQEKSMKGITLWILPLGLMAGWSNENMGPTCFLITAAVMIWTCVKTHKVPVWAAEGVITSLVGSILVVAAPGNFLRSTFVEKPSLYERFFSMLTAGVDYLFPSFLLLTLLLLVKLVLKKEKLEGFHYAMLAGMILSYGAMVVSPHYPDRATFGSMVFGIILCVTLLGDLEKSADTERMDLITGMLVLGAFFRMSTVLLWQ